MSTKKYMAARVVALIVLGSSCVASAQQRACLIEGSFTIGTTTTEIRDCIRNDGVAQEQFVETCNSLAQATAALGGPDAQVSYLPACPTPSQGSCSGFFGQPMTSYYYDRDAAKLAAKRRSCTAQGGRWQ